MKAFITGANGFVGGWLSDWLKSNGDEVSSLNEKTDINDEDSMLNELEAFGPDVIYHLAALSHVGDSWGNPKEVFEVNALGTLTLTEVIKRLKTSPRLLIVSSAEVYGKVDEAELPISETRVVNPMTPYAVSKVSAEYIGLQAFQNGLDVIVVRPFNHVGPKQSDKFVISGLAKRIVEAKLSGSNQIIVGNLSSRRDYTDVRSVVKGYRLLIDNGKAGEIYNICSGVDRSVLDIATELIRIAGVDIELVRDPALSRSSDVPVLRGNASKIESATGWQVDIDFISTLKDTLDYWEEVLTRI
jgi:GDP-4-dehydro-6-deoxy-D-mannose reductase